MATRPHSKKRSAKDAEIRDLDDYQPSKRHRENIKQFPRPFDVIFRNIKFEIRVDANMTLSDFKNKMKKYASRMMPDIKASDIDNEHLRFTLSSGQSCLRNDDDAKMGDLFRFDVSDVPKLELIVEEAICITLKISTSSLLHGIFVYPSELMESIFFKAFKLANKEYNQDYWFNLYCKRHGDSPLCSGETVKKMLIDGDKLEMKYDSERIKNKPPTMQIFVKTLTGRTITIDTLAEGKDTVQNLKWMIGCHTGIRRRRQRLLWAGRQMQDGIFLSDYKVVNESTIHLALRLTGS